MALSDCAIVSGFTIDCRSDVGGIKTIDIVETSAISSFTYASGTCSAMVMNSGKKYYTFALEQATCTANDDLKPNAANGSIYFEQKFTLIVNKRSASFSYYMKNLAQNNLSAIFTTNDETPRYFVGGLSNGFKLQDGKSGFGTALSDRSGYELNFTAMEVIPFLQISAAIHTQLMSPA